MAQITRFAVVSGQKRAAGLRLEQPVALSEVFADTPGDAGAAGFILSCLAKGGLVKGAGPVLWIQDRMSRREAGRPHLAGLGDGCALLVMTIARPADVLIAAEEGLRCRALSAVVAEIWGNPAALDFTATKRLVLRAAAGRGAETGVPCWLLRHAGQPDLSAARDRWRVASLPSLPDPDDAMAPGAPRWRAELFRSRNKPPGTWIAQHDRAADRVGFAAAIRDGAVADRAAEGGQRHTR